jgi:hypothetical protein
MPKGENDQRQRVEEALFSGHTAKNEMNKRQSDGDLREASDGHGSLLPACRISGPVSEEEPKLLTIRR